MNINEVMIVPGEKTSHRNSFWQCASNSLLSHQDARVFTNFIAHFALLILKKKHIMLRGIFHKMRNITKVFF
jgi:hypothetical protein